MRSDQSVLRAVHFVEGGCGAARYWFGVAAGLVLTLSFFVACKVMRRVVLAAAVVAKPVRADKIIREHPYLVLAASQAVLLPAAYRWNTSEGWAGMALAGLVAWLAMSAAMASVAIVSKTAPIILPTSARKWFAARLRNPRDTYYVNLLVFNSLIIIPALGIMLVPSLFCVFTLVVYLTVWLYMSLLQESLIHSDVHNHLFRWKHLKDHVDKSIFKIMNLYIKIVIPFISCRFPFHYTVEHAMIHHVENNGASDVQSTLAYDRTSFIDFSRFAFRIALQLAFSGEWYQYLAQRGMRRPIQTLVRGQALRYGILAGIYCFNAPAAILLLVVPLLSGVVRASTVFFWHGLVDTGDPENVYKNSINIAAGSAAVHAWHVEHHVNPNDHWAKMRNSAERDAANYARQDTIVFAPNPFLRHLFLRALWTRRFDLLARMCVPTSDAQRDPAHLARIIEERTRPIVPVGHGRCYRSLDAWLGRVVATYMLAGRFPSERSGRPRERVIPDLGYVEG